MNQGGNNYKIYKTDLLYPDLSFEINGVLFEVFNLIGGSHPEKTIQKAVAVVLQQRGLGYVEQFYVPVKIGDKVVGKYFLDFLIEGKIVLELKRGRYLPKNVYKQMEQYLQTINLPLAIVGCFAHDCVIIKRIVNHEFRNS
ncbi:MAG: GxxExxY protein [Candidatus Magasanikbacteria bacterium]|nr:GxxExxY protein [Candidatus Magasanikbacteria bacterium]